VKVKDVFSGLQHVLDELAGVDKGLGVSQQCEDIVQYFVTVHQLAGHLLSLWLQETKHKYKKEIINK
jgi:hypothetical protein